MLFLYWIIVNYKKYIRKNRNFYGRSGGEGCMRHPFKGSQFRRTRHQNSQNPWDIINGRSKRKLKRERPFRIQCFSAPCDPASLPRLCLRSNFLYTAGILLSPEADDLRPLAQKKKRAPESIKKRTTEKKRAQKTRQKARCGPARQIVTKSAGAHGASAAVIAVITESRFTIVAQQTRARERGRD